MKKFLIIVGLFLAALTIWRIATYKKNAEAPQRDIIVKVQPVQFGPIDDMIYYQGKLAGARQASLYPPFAAKVEQVLVQPGERVVRNQRLIRLDNEVYQSRLSAAEAQLNAAKQNFQAMSDELNRQKHLFEANASSQKTYQMVMTQYENARAAMTAGEQSWISARKQLAESYLASPFDGIVISCNADIGAQVNPAVPVIVVADTTSWRVKLDLSASDMRRIRPGMSALVIPSESSDTLRGRIDWSDLGIDPSQGKGNAEILITNTGAYPVVAGTWCDIWIILQRKEKTLLIPGNAIVEETRISDVNKGGSSLGFIKVKTVFVVENGLAVQKDIVAGIVNDRWTEALSGLAPDQKVVIEGQRRLKINQPVKTVE